MTFPNKLENVAKDAGHLCPEMLKEELTEFGRVKGYLPHVILIHLSPQFEEKIREEAQEIAEELKLSIGIACEGEKFII